MVQKLFNGLKTYGVAYASYLKSQNKQKKKNPSKIIQKVYIKHMYVYLYPHMNNVL